MKKEQLFSSPGRLVGEGGGEGGGGGEEREERRRGRRELPVSYDSTDGRLALLDIQKKTVQTITYNYTSAM